MLKYVRVGFAGLISCIAGSNVCAQSAPTAITYQGYLEHNGVRLTDSLPMLFRLYDAAVAGTQIAGPINIASVAIEDGVFTQSLDFGVLDTGNQAMWLEIEVDGYIMSPRQEITPSPYSLQTRGIHVDADGRVGIGTGSPTASVEIAGDEVEILARSDQDNRAVNVRLQSNVTNSIGGTYSNISFENGFGAEDFVISHENFFQIDYLRLGTSSEPGLMRVRWDGTIGIGDVPSITRLHVTESDIGIFNDYMLNETLALEDDDSVLGIYSTPTGSYGSGIVLGEIDGNSGVDKWGLVRTTSNTDPELRVTYGSNANYAKSSIRLVRPRGDRVRGRDGTDDRG